ncbi:glycosyltransferase family 2 protein [Paraflavitalea sp. CAU 1676]|uniref:glycosyltransferase family 2 protein n=1 Tax=Paraflavitalea sp. CAU 1676 TaxID=3032598 RepID=UPI0023DB5D5F|nr:glycosyltransferase family 2 protein [Paraflavitalea sp. CAU 1676]MDF2187079.1 glycosyltransferase family 2 protein [Paraflavitalea sp. CAU 1676]
MTISIITATYNSAETVRDTLTSVARQDHPSIEHIIIDGVSKDGTLDIVKDFPHVARIVCEKDRGIYDAMNKGLKVATGDVVGILNSDDFYNNDQVLSRVMAAFEDPAIDVVYGDLQYVRKNDVYVVTRHWKSGRYKRKYFYYGWMPPHPTFFVRRRIYEQVGVFNTDLRSAADYEMMLRILVRHDAKAGYIPEVLVKMRAGGMSNASLKNRLRANREDRMAWALNDLKPFFFTTWLKPVRKIFQFITR